MKQKKRNNKRKLNNKGLSLIEVLVAILLLSIASIALLRSFSYAVQLNTKSKENQYASVLAQGLMESLKAYDVDSLDTEFSRAATEYASFTVFPVSSGVSFSKSGVGLAERQYGLNNVQFNGSTYDVLIKMTPDTSLQKDLTMVMDANRYHDAFFRQSISDKQLLYDEIKQYLIDSCNADSSHLTEIDKTCVTLNSRTIEADITDQTVNFYVTYNYSLNAHRIQKADGTEEFITESNKTFTIDYDAVHSQKYDNTATAADGAVLANIYIYYYPHYSYVGAGYHVCNSDKVEIINNSGSVKNVFIIRQKDTYLTASELANGESCYKLQVDNTGSKSVNLFHNVKESLSDSGMPNFYGTPTNVIDKGTLWQADVTTNLLYDVEITVSKNGEEFCKLIGTTNAH